MYLTHKAERKQTFAYTSMELHGCMYLPPLPPSKNETVHLATNLYCAPQSLFARMSQSGELWTGVETCGEMTKTLGTFCGQFLTLQERKKTVIPSGNKCHSRLELQHAFVSKVLKISMHQSITISIYSPEFPHFHSLFTVFQGKHCCTGTFLGQENKLDCFPVFPWVTGPHTLQHFSHDGLQTPSPHPDQTFSGIEHIN